MNNTSTPTEGEKEANSPPAHEMNRQHNSKQKVMLNRNIVSAKEKRILEKYKAQGLGQQEQEQCPDNHCGGVGLRMNRSLASSKVSAALGDSW